MGRKGIRVFLSNPWPPLAPKAGKRPILCVDSSLPQAISSTPFQPGRLQYLLLRVVAEKSSVRKGEAGSPAPLNKLQVGLSAQA